MVFDVPSGRRVNTSSTIPTQASGLATTSSTDFDLWLKMASDNKINAKNSWNFALIDYFHDLSLLRDGDGINFRKASATLDGCVKIYSSRVDSAATETGILLSGLSKQQNQELRRRQGGSQEFEENEGSGDDVDEYEGEDSDDSEHGIHRRKVLRNVKRESTLAKSFNAIKAKRVDSELQVDPVFRKALADFDEGGASSMLLNMLNIDSKGRVIFNSDKREDEEKAAQTEGELKGGNIYMNDTNNMDIISLGRRFLPSNLERFLICPSMKEIQDISRTFKDNNLYEKLIRDNNNDNQKDGNGGNEENDDDFAHTGSIFYDDNDYDNDDFFNERSVNLTIQRLFDESRIQQDDDERQEVIGDVPDYDLLAYFDNNMKKHWLKRKTPDHWKVANLKSSKGYRESKKYNKNGDNQEEAQVIDFLNDEEDNEDEIFSESNTTTFLPKHQWSNQRKEGNCNLLANDIQFTSKRLIKHFIKPDKLLRTFNKRKRLSRTTDETHEESKNNTGVADEDFWSQKYQEYDTMNEIEREDLLELNQTYDQSFFEDNVAGDGDGINPMGDEFDVGEGGYGSQLLFQKNLFKPTYINFSRVAKRVDVTLLKDNLWLCLNENENNDKENEEESKNVDTKEEIKLESKFEKQFSDTVQDLTLKYSPEQMNNLSTSVCFICILHLANEHGLYIVNNPDNTDLKIQMQLQSEIPI